MHFANSITENLKMSLSGPPPFRSAPGLNELLHNVNTAAINIGAVCRSLVSLREGSWMQQRHNNHQERGTDMQTAPNWLAE